MSCSSPWCCWGCCARGGAGASGPGCRLWCQPCSQLFLPFIIALQPYDLYHFISISWQMCACSASVYMCDCGWTNFLIICRNLYSLLHIAHDVPFPRSLSLHFPPLLKITNWNLVYIYFCITFYSWLLCLYQTKFNQTFNHLQTDTLEKFTRQFMFCKYTLLL